MARTISSFESGRSAIARLWCCSMVALLLGALLPMPALAGQTATEMVQRTINDILYILAELKDTSRSGQRQWEIEQVVRRSFHYEDMAERALGETANRSSPADRRQYVRLFVQVLRDDLTDKLRDYGIAQVAYLSERSNADGTQVMIAPAGSESDARIEFQLVQRSGAWLVNDVSIDGASIVANYHLQFSRILRDGSFSDLMEYMKHKALVARVIEKVDS